MEIVVGELMACGLSPVTVLDMTYPSARAILRALHEKEKRQFEAMAATAGMKL